MGKLFTRLIVSDWKSPFQDIILKNSKSLVNHGVAIAQKTGRQYQEVQAEIVAFNTVADECQLCGCQKSFKSLKFGYRCDNDPCKIIMSDRVDEVRQNSLLPETRKSLAYQEYVLENIDWYFENQHVVGCIDPYFKKSIGKRTLKAAVSARVPNSNYFTSPWSYETSCRVCSEVFTTNLFERREVCRSKTCIAVEVNAARGKSQDFTVLTRKKIQSQHLEDFWDVLHKNLTNYEFLYNWLNARDMVGCIGIVSFLRHTMFPDKLQYTAMRSFLHHYVNGDKIKFVSLKNGILPKFSTYRMCDILCWKEVFLQFPEQEDVLLENFPDILRKCIVCGKVHTYGYKDLVKFRFCSKQCYDISLTKQYVDKIHPDSFNNESSRKRQSDTMKRKIQDGSFTPNVTNSWAKSRLVINGIKYRSSWDALFGILNQSAEYERLRIPYIMNGEWHNYIVDFVDHLNKVIYEIKPNSEMNTAKNVAKFAAATDWCEKMQYNLVIINDDWISDAMSNRDTISVLHDLPSDVRDIMLYRLRQFLKDEK